MFKNISFRILLTVLVASLWGCKDNFELIRRDPDWHVKLAKGLEYYDNGEYQKAQYLFEDIMPYVKADSTGEKVFFRYAYTHYFQKNFNFASHYFKQFYSTYYGSPLGEEALFMSAKCSFMLSPNYRLEQSSTDEAIEGFQLFINTFPNSPRVEESNQLIDQLRAKMEVKAYDAANLYYRLSDFKSATYSFQNLLKDYPDSKNDEKIRFNIIRSNYKLALNSVEDKQEERYNETIVFYYDFIDRYPQSSFLGEAQKIFTACQDQIKKLRQK